MHPSFPLRATACALLLASLLLTIRQTGYWQTDVALFTHATEVNPHSYVGYINLGGVYQRNHDPARALAAFDNATRANPDYALAWSNLADELADSGRLDEAIAAVRKSIALQTQNPNLRPAWPHDNALLGELLFEKSRFAEAIPYLQTAADADPDKGELTKELKTAQQRAATQPATSQPAK